MPACSVIAATVERLGRLPSSRPLRRSSTKRTAGFGPDRQLCGDESSLIRARRDSRERRFTRRAISVATPVSAQAHAADARATTGSRCERQLDVTYREVPACRSAAGYEGMFDSVRNGTFSSAAKEVPSVILPCDTLSPRSESPTDLIVGDQPAHETALTPHSTVTLFAKFLGLSTSVPRAQAV